MDGAYVAGGRDGVSAGRYAARSERTALSASASASRTEREKPEEPALDAPPVTLERNGVAHNGDMMAVIGDALFLLYRTTAIIKLIRQAQQGMSLGWYAQIDCNVFQGAIEATWGWKEHDDHRAYFETAINLEMLVLGVALEVGIGAVVGCVGGQICVRFDGECKYKVEAICFGKPEDGDPPQAETPLGGYEAAIKGGFYARALCGTVMNAEAAAVVELKLEGKAALDGQRRFGSESKVAFTGVVAQVTVQGFWGTTVQKQQLMDGKTLVDGLKYPDPARENRADLRSKKDVGAVFLSYLEAGWFPVRILRVTDRGMLYDDTVAISNASVADAFADRVWGQRHLIDMDRKVIEGLAHAVRQKCEALGARWLRDWVDEAEARRGAEALLAAFRGGDAATLLAAWEARMHDVALIRGVAPPEARAQVEQAIAQAFALGAAPARSGETIALTPWCDGRLVEATLDGGPLLVTKEPDDAHMAFPVFLGRRGGRLQALR